MLAVSEPLQSDLRYGSPYLLVTLYNLQRSSQKERRLALLSLRAELRVVACERAEVVRPSPALLRGGSLKRGWRRAAPGAKGPVSDRMFAGDLDVDEPSAGWRGCFGLAGLAEITSTGRR